MQGQREMLRVHSVFVSRGSLDFPELFKKFVYIKEKHSYCVSLTFHGIKTIMDKNDNRKRKQLPKLTLYLLIKFL